MIAEQIAEQKRQDAHAVADAKDKVTLIALAGKELTAQQRAIADEQEITTAERRLKELARVRDGAEAAAGLAAAQSELATARHNHQVAAQKLLAEHAPKMRQCLTKVDQLQQLKNVGDRSLMWLIETAPPHVSEPLAHLRRLLLRERQYLSRNENEFAAAKARLKAAKAGELEFPAGMAANNGWAHRLHDDRARRDRNRQYSRDMVQSLQKQVDGLRPIYENSKARVETLQSQVEGLDALTREAWPTRAQVTEILGRAWEPQPAATKVMDGFINSGLGTPSEALA